MGNNQYGLHNATTQVKQLHWGVSSSRLANKNGTFHTSKERDHSHRNNRRINEACLQTSWITQQNHLRGTQFAAKVTEEMYKKLNIQVALSTAYHPQTDGQTERVNQDLETYIRLYCDHRQSDWSQWLHLAEFSYNNKEHSTTKISPFMANNLTMPQWQQETKLENMTHPAAEEHLKEMKNVEEELKACLDLAAERMKEMYNKGEIPTFQEGDMVYLNARNLKEKIQARDEPTRSMMKKLWKKRIGPLRVLRKIGDLNYQLELPTSMMDKNIHNVFHINLLTKAPKDTIPGRIPPKPLQ